jgi:hypothetical protein
MRPYPLVQVLIVQKASEHGGAQVGKGKLFLWQKMLKRKKNVRTEGIRLGETRFEGAKASRKAMLWECFNHYLRFVVGQFPTE